MQAIQFVKEFEQSKVVLTPVTRGWMYFMAIKGGKVRGPDLKYLVVDPCKQELQVFKAINGKAEVIRLSLIMCIVKA